jgi:hypothetical protein
VKAIIVLATARSRGKFELISIVPLAIIEALEGISASWRLRFRPRAAHQAQTLDATDMNANEKTPATAMSTSSCARILHGAALRGDDAGHIR